MTKKSYFLVFAILLCFISCTSDSENENVQPVDQIAPKVQFTISGVDPNAPEPILVDGVLEIEVDASDLGGISKVEAFINNQKVGEALEVPYRFTINLSSFASKTGKSMLDKNATLKITATDKAGNQTSVEKAITFLEKTPLITITFPEGFLNYGLENVHVFASTMSGELLEGTTMPINSTTRYCTLLAPYDFKTEDEFMITFMSTNPHRDAPLTYGTTYQNLTIENPGEINLKIPNRLEGTDYKLFPANGFNIDSFPKGDGSDYRTNFDINENMFSFHTLNPVNSPQLVKNNMFLWNNSTMHSDDYSYIFIERPLPENFELNASDFETEHSAFGSISFPNFPEVPEIRTELTILGYESDTDFQNDAYHTVYAHSKGNYPFPMLYGYYSAFHSYRYRMSMQYFYVEDQGLPLSTYTIPEWDLNPVLVGNSIHLNKTGTGHAVGRVMLRSNSLDYIYIWNILFDSEKAETVVVPKLPDVFHNTAIHENMSLNTLSIRQAAFRKYENIPTYENYLNTVLKENIDSRDVSEKVEIKYKWEYPVYEQVKDLFFY